MSIKPDFIIGTTGLLQQYLNVKVFLCVKLYNNIQVNINSETGQALDH